MGDRNSVKVTDLFFFHSNICDISDTREETYICVYGALRSGAEICSIKNKRGLGIIRSGGEIQ